MDSNTIVALLGGGGIAAIISAIIAGLFSKRKLGAEAADIITKAAAGVVTNMQAEIDRQVGLNKTLVDDHERKMAERDAEYQRDRAHLMADFERQMTEVRNTLQLHVAWDVIAIAKMNDIGVELPPPPPLLPESFSDNLSSEV